MLKRNKIGENAEEDERKRRWQGGGRGKEKCAILFQKR
jgi:hypothetical protein